MTKQIEKMTKQRQEYLKFKPFADDLRKAESWCELDGVLNRYQTVKNLSKMGYRKQGEGEWKMLIYNDHCSCGKSRKVARYECSVCKRVADMQPYGLTFCPNCGARMRGKNNG